MITCTHWSWMFWYLLEFCPSVKLLICLMAKKMDPEDGLEKKSQTTSMRLSRNINTKKGWALQTNVINQKWEIEKLPFVFINVCCFIFQSVSRVQTLWIMNIPPVGRAELRTTLSWACLPSCFLTHITELPPVCDVWTASTWLSDTGLELSCISLNDPARVQ